MKNLSEEAVIIAKNIDRYFPVRESQVRQVLCLSEEVGEFVQAFRRWKGMARRAGNFNDVMEELADIVITAYVTSVVLGGNLDASIENKLNTIMTRGWKDASNTEVRPHEEHRPDEEKQIRSVQAVRNDGGSGHQRVQGIM